MKYLLLLIIGLFSIVKADACVTYNGTNNTYTVDGSGCVGK